ncbi:ATP-binding protein [Thiohalobacter thiocyanaticus]|uniref:ATP-binding protein n=1 Tax=Thiohalobacter thiocyanaticus TaxID=585455 RepID=A0A426QKY1_9GAMM|nr:ATP-binding protein [Thiohalobacter thiocyanaticus]RRQ22444.1 ATP-binding protein [Thiohalobacter thiocyanaticus]
MSVHKLTRDAVLRVGEVSGVDGRRIYVMVDKNKNLSDMFLDGDILKNISVNSYIEIRKGFLSIIGRVEGEMIQEESRKVAGPDRETVYRDKRILTVSLSGYIDETGVFIGGTRELPLIGNEAYIVTRDKIHLVHNLVRPGSPSVNIATIFGEDFDIDFPVDGLFNSHIAIFGNTGSGKSNTVARLYQELVRVLSARNERAFESNARFVLFDFNGEYTNAACIADNKTVYNLSTRNNDGDRLPMPADGLLDIEALSILADATDKTQKPFLRRMLRFFNRVHSEDVDNPEGYLKAIIRKRVSDALQMSDKLRAFLLIDYFREILPSEDTAGEPVDLVGDLDWHNQSQEFYIKATNIYLRQHADQIDSTRLYNHVDNFDLPDSLLSQLIIFLYLQLIYDVIVNRAQNEHIVPVINRLKSKRHDIDKIFNLGDDNFWQSNFVVLNLSDVNLDMKKTLPLLLSKKLYSEHKNKGPNQSLNIIIDEAHNILSTESFREAENWKDYRLETFEEIIKEGRKFGVFITIASQRPNDISPTITSQAHNYFIHRLINERDLRTIASAVSYIDRVTEESIPTLPTGTCVFSGVASQVPLKINVKPLAENAQPRSATRKFGDIVPPAPEAI